MKSVTELVTSLKTYFLGKIADEATTRSAMGAKNMVPYPYYNGDSRDTNGILFTVNSDGSITISGQATADAYFRLTYNTGDVHVPLVAGKSYILSASGKADVAFLLRDSSTSNVASARATDATYNCTTAGNYDVILGVDNGADYSTPITVYPMLRLATDVNSDYQPYAKTNKELTDAANSLNTALSAEATTRATADSNEAITRAKNGAHNIMPFDLATAKSKNTSGTWSNSTYTINNLEITVNSDGTIDVDGTASANTIFWVCRDYTADNTLNLSGNPSGGSSTTYALVATNGSNYYNDAGEGVEVPAGTYSFYIYVSSGTVISNKTYKPMLRLATDTVSEYTPYAPTNQELAGVVPTMTMNGAHNLDVPTDTYIYKTTWSRQNNGYHVQCTSVTNWGQISVLYENLPKNTDFTLRTNVIITSGTKCGISVYGSNSSSFDNRTVIKDFPFTSGGQKELTFNSGNYEYISFALFASYDVSEQNDVTYADFLFKLTSDKDNTYTEPAMTNHQLTEELIGTDALSPTVNTTNVTETGQGLKYVVKNGVCYVSAKYIKMKTTGDGVIVATGLPKAKMFVTAMPLSPHYTDPAPNNSFFIPDGDTQLKCNANDITVENFFSFSYSIE